MSEFSIPFTTVVWTTGDTITEAKLDNMVANDQAYDAHEDQGLQLARRSGDPSTPASTKLRLYAKDYDGKTALFVINESGDIFRLHSDPVVTSEIVEATSDTGVTIDGVLLKDGEVTTDTIHEETDGNGVVIDGLTIKDGKLDTANSVVEGNITANAVVEGKINNNAVTNNKIRQSAGLSVIGRSANSTGNVADIVAANNNEVLRRSGTSIGFGQVATAGIADGAVNGAKMAGTIAGNKIFSGAISVGHSNSPGSTYVLDLRSSSNGLIAQMDNQSSAGGADVLKLRHASSLDGNSYFIQFHDSGDNLVGGVHSGVVYQTFTGAHWSQSDEDIEIGMIVTSNGHVIREKLAFGENALVGVSIARERMDKRVYGVVASVVEMKESKMIEGFNFDRPLLSVNALGEGVIYVTDTNGELQNGDYVTTSHIAGLGELQDDDILHSYTVAKITQDIDWSKAEDIDSGYKKILVACTYHCG